MIWFPNFNPGRLIYFLLLVERDCSHVSLRRYVHTQNRGDFTIVFWPDKPGTPSHRLGSLRTNTGSPLTWLSRLWMLWRMSAPTGLETVEVGPLEMPSISSFQVRRNGREDKALPLNKNQ